MFLGLGSWELHDPRHILISTDNGIMYNCSFLKHAIHQRFSNPYKKDTHSQKLVHLVTELEDASCECVDVR